MFPAAPGSGRSALLCDRGLGLGLVELVLEEGLLGFGDEAEGLGLGQVALAGLAGGVGGHREAFESLDLARSGERLDVPGAGLAGVVLLPGAGTGGEDGEVGIGVLREAQVVLPILRGQAELLEAGGGELAGGGV